MSGDLIRGLRLRIAVLLMLCSTVAGAASGQVPVGSIEGVVKDESGAILPGLTVDATSPALIERTRSAVTDESGTYQLLQLPAGTYSLRFSLGGFQTLERGNVTINGGFTATINAVVKLGSIEETVTVAGETPLVDVRTTTTQVVVTAETVNTVPSSRHVFDMQKFLIGASTSRPDVGGSDGFQSTTFKLHGSRSTEKMLYIDGISTEGFSGNGGAGLVSYGATGAAQELDYTTSALPASYSYGGIAISSVTKSGGNDLSGDLFVDPMVAQSANLDDSLRSRGVRAGAGMKAGYDVDAGLGGPIVRDRAWFFFTNRTWMLNNYVTNSFNTDKVTQATDWSWRSENFYKGTVKLNNANRLSIFNTTNFYDRPARRAGASFIEPEATYYDGNNHNNLFLSAVLTGTGGASWLYEAQVNQTQRLVYNFYNSLVEPGAVTHLDIVKDLLYGAPNTPNYTLQKGHNISGSLTKVGNWHGGHNLKGGVQSSRGGNVRDVELNGDIFALRLRDGVPDSVDLRNTPVHRESKVSNLSFYLQDGWRLQRLTINAGVRYDRFHAYIPAQLAPAGTWVPVRQTSPIDVITWNDVKPRLGLAYDLAGDARTVLKGSFSEYVGPASTGLPDSVNPLNDASNRCAWRDLNGDLNLQAGEISACQGFPSVSIRIDPTLPRPNSREYSAGVQRQLSANWAAVAMYFRRENTLNSATRNLAVPYDSYIPVVIVNPLDNSPLTISNQNPATAGRQDNILTTDPKLDTIFNGVEFSIQRRFSATAYLQGGYAYGKDRGRIAAGELNDPNDDIYADGAVGNDQPHQLKVSAAFVLPGQLSVSTFFQAYSGNPRVRTLSVSRTLVPTLTRASQNVRLEPNDAIRYEANQLLDLRVGRRFNAGQLRYEVFVDVFNVLNANTVLSDVTAIGSSLGNVSDMIAPRLVRIGGKVSF